MTETPETHIVDVNPNKSGWADLAKFRAHTEDQQGEGDKKQIYQGVSELTTAIDQQTDNSVLAVLEVDPKAVAQHNAPNFFIVIEPGEKMPDILAGWTIQERPENGDFEEIEIHSKDGAVITAGICHPDLLQQAFADDELLVNRKQVTEIYRQTGAGEEQDFQFLDGVASDEEAAAVFNEVTNLYENKITPETVVDDLNESFIYEKDGQEKVGGYFETAFTAESQSRQFLNSLLADGVIDVDAQNGNKISISDQKFIKGDDDRYKSTNNQEDPNAISAQEIVQAFLTNHELVRNRAETLSLQLTAQEANKISEFTDDLFQNRDKAVALIIGMIDFQAHRMKVSGREPSEINDEQAHIINVTGMAFEQNIQTKDQLIQLIKNTADRKMILNAIANSVHDAVKHGEDNLFALAGHEAYSERGGAEIAQLATKSIGYDDETSTAIYKLLRKSISTHGEFEFPENVAKAGCEPIMVEKDGQSMGVYLVKFPFGPKAPLEVYISPPRSTEMEILSTAVTVDDEVRELITSVGIDMSQKDKLSGMDPSAITKYMNTRPAETMFVYENGGEFILDNYFNTFISYYNKLPNHKGHVLEEIWWQMGFLAKYLNVSNEIPQSDQLSSIRQLFADYEGVYKQGITERSGDSNEQKLEELKVELKTSYGKLVSALKEISVDEIKKHVSDSEIATIFREKGLTAEPIGS